MLYNLYFWKAQQAEKEYLIVFCIMSNVWYDFCTYINPAIYHVNAFKEQFLSYLSSHL